MTDPDNATDAAPADDGLTIPAAPEPTPAPTLEHEDLTTREASLVAHIKAWAHATFGGKADPAPARTTFTEQD